MGRRRQRLHRMRLAAKRQATTVTTNPTVGIENSVVQEMLAETTKTSAPEPSTTPIEIEETPPVMEAITPSPTEKKPKKATTRVRATKRTRPRVSKKRTIKSKSNSSK